MLKPLKKEISELEKSKLNILVKEYELTNIKIEKFVGNQLLFTQGSLALAGGYIFFLIEGIAVIDNTIKNQTDTKLYLQFLPFFVLMILTGILYQYQRTIGLQGYKQYLENKINLLLGENLICYGHIGMKYMLRKNIIALLNTFLYGLIYVAASVLALIKPSEPTEPAWWVAHIVAFIVFLIIALTQTTNYSNKVKNLAVKINLSESSLSEFEY